MEMIEKPVSRYSYYDVLEVNPLSPQHEVTLAYERAKATYSGENPAVYTIFSEKEAREMLRLVEEAYSVVGNKSLRILYDEKLVTGALRNEEVTAESLQTESKSRALANQLPKKPKIYKLDYPKDADFEQQILEMKDWTGQVIRQVREYKQVSLDQLSEITKISSFYLHAVEDMHPEQLPARVFVRGYVAQICRVLNLNEKVVCDSYMQHFQTKTS